MFRIFKRRDISTQEVVAIVERAYNQAWWDSQRAKSPRYAISNKTDGLARFMEREADKLR
jgi:hypothetical protein